MKNEPVAEAPSRLALRGSQLDDPRPRDSRSSGEGEQHLEHISELFDSLPSGSRCADLISLLVQLRHQGGVEVGARDDGDLRITTGRPDDLGDAVTNELRHD